jgi:hypothetical protein
LIRHRVLIDIQFDVDEVQYKLAQLTHDATGVSEVSEEGVRDIVTSGLIGVDWAQQGLAPIRSTVTTRVLSPGGGYAQVYVPADPDITVA